MQSSVFAQKKPTSPIISPDALFDSSFYQPYRAAVETAFYMLCRARKLLYDDIGSETIRQMTFRLKTPGSICGKLRKKSLPLTCEAAHTALHDIAGLRVVFSCIESVYHYAALLTASPPAEYITCRDYIAQPKKSGYQSLHLLMMIPVVHAGQRTMIPVEIQLRTSAMDTWATLDHDAFYKPSTSDSATLS